MSFGDHVPYLCVLAPRKDVQGTVYLWAEGTSYLLRDLLRDLLRVDLLSYLLRYLLRVYKLLVERLVERGQVTC